MKRKGLILSTSLLFALGLYLAYEQGNGLASLNILESSIAAPSSLVVLTGFKAAFLQSFAGVLNALTSLFAGSLVAAIIVLALVVELATLYPAVNIQLKQKKIHLFHKKLIDRFHSGDLTMGKAKRELDVLYSVNERIHSRGALLVSFQLAAFLVVLGGLYLLSSNPSVLTGAFNSFDFALLSKSSSAYMPLLTALGYTLHALIKIATKQQEDYIAKKQINLAIGFAIIGSALVFFFAGTFSVLLSVYFLTQITFASMRYLVVDQNSKAWGKLAQRDLIKLLRSAEVHKTKLEKASRKFNHKPFIRNINLHLLEEAVSMSLVLVLIVNGLRLI